MTYFLDFDRTLFDNERYTNYTLTLPAWQEFHQRVFEYKRRPDGTSAVTPEARGKLFGDIETWYTQGGYTFTAGELAPYLYGDVVDFLTMYGSQCVIVTSGAGGIELQKGKVAATGVMALVRDTVFVNEADGFKGPVIQRLQGAAGDIFVDDSELQLDSVALHVPAVALRQMVRDYATRAGTRYPVIRTLSEV